jgi:hypothetical protein
MFWWVGVGLCLWRVSKHSGVICGGSVVRHAFVFAAVSFSFPQMEEGTVDGLLLLQLQEFSSISLYLWKLGRALAH